MQTEAKANARHFLDEYPVSVDGYRKKLHTMETVAFSSAKRQPFVVGSYAFFRQRTTVTCPMRSRLTPV